MFKEFIEILNERFPHDKPTHEGRRATKKSLTSSKRNCQQEHATSAHECPPPPKILEYVVLYKHTVVDRDNLETFEITYVGQQQSVTLNLNTHSIKWMARKTYKTP